MLFIAVDEKDEKREEKVKFCKLFYSLCLEIGNYFGHVGKGCSDIYPTN